MPRSAVWRSLPESQMCAILVVVANILREQASQVTFVNCDDVIQEITPATPYPTLCDSILPRTSERGADRTHHQGSTRCGHFQSILGITIKDDEKTIEHAEGDRRNSKEVHRGNRFPVITEKGKPALSRLRISRCPFHPTRDRSLRDIKTEHEKLPMDARRSPRWILNDHPEDQFLNLLRRLPSPDGPPNLGDQLPVQTESAPVPTHHGFGCDRNEGLLPSGPESTDGDPEELVEQV